MSDSSRLSIITITRDDPDGLARTLASAAPWRAAVSVEHVVVDGGKEAAVVSPGQNVLCLHQAANGIADAFNMGLEAASGEWLWFVNGGDAVHEDLEPRWLLTLLAHSHADLVVGGIHYDGEVAPRRAPALASQWPLTECWIPHPATLVRRKALKAAGGFDPRWTIAMDFDLWHRVLKRDTLVDVVSMPFARFDTTGLSHRLESRGVVQAEGSRIVLRNAVALTGNALRGVARAVRAVGRAGFTRIRSSRKHGGGLS